ncbi:adenylate/guanylate cyclase domain-containing protein [Candidatus Bipolaricaulota bacterium]
MTRPRNRIAGRDVDEQPLAIGFSDLRGFSLYTAERGDRQAFRLASRFSDLVERQVSEGGGVVLKTYGDGVMTSYERASDALQCATAMQEALSRYNESHEEEPLSAGIGLSWGSVIHTGDDVFGHSVNLAKRLADVAKGGQVIVSSSVCERTGTGEGFCLRDLGDHEIKDLGTHQLFELVWREEVANLCLSDDSLNVVLTEDDKLVLEFAKSIEEKLQFAQEKLLEEAGSEGGGAVALLRRQVASRLSKTLPRWIDSFQASAGLGEEHRLDQVKATLNRGRLTIQLPTGKKLRFDGHQVDIGQAERFIEKLRVLKGESGSGS